MVQEYESPRRRRPSHSADDRYESSRRRRLDQEAEGEGESPRRRRSAYDGDDVQGESSRRRPSHSADEQDAQISRRESSRDGRRGSHGADERKPETEPKRDKIMMIIGLVVIVAGVVVAFFPQIGQGVAVFIAGLSLAMTGVAGILKWFKAPKRSELPKGTLSTALVETVIGVVFVFYPVVSGTVMTVVIIAGLIIYGLCRVYQGKCAKDGNESGWLINFIVGGISVICGLILIFATGLLSMIVGAVIVICGISLVYAGLTAGKK